MCGIVGIVDTRGRRPIDRDLLATMNESQFHRGPDESGLHVEPGVGLGHRRLSIIDLSTGQQPLFNEDGSVVVVYNGEIYNFVELKSELTAAGHVFRTASDTEVIVHAWEQWGARCVERFRGMFAFALWDRTNRTLFMARDRLGIKPLYYSVLSNGMLVFGSELKALLLHPDLARRISSQSVEDYFAFGYVPDPNTILEGVYKLSPGHTLSLTGDGREPVVRQYWDVSFSDTVTGSVEDLREELLSRLREAVHIRMVADVPLGAFLSGGVDSSAVVGSMAALSERRVKTCSISFGDPAYNESRYASAVAEKFNTEHRVAQVEAEDFALLDRLATLYDEPYADSSAIPTYRVCEMARREVTVALSGDGGDESFAGYRRYRWHMFEERFRGTLPRAVREPLFGTLGALYPKADWAPRFLRAKSTFQAIARSSVEGYLHSVSILPDHVRERLFNTRFKRDLQGYRAIEVFLRHANQAPVNDALSLVQYLDMKTYLPGDILTKVDRASMAHSLEVRVPILDHHFVEWVAAMPAGLKLHGREGKYVFKRALETMLPREILYRSKMGFAVPLAGWFRGPLAQRSRDAVLSPLLNDLHIFERDFLRKLVNDHQRGLRDNSAPIWSLLMFESFCRQILSDDERSVLPSAALDAPAA